MSRKRKREWAICPDCEGEGRIVHPELSVWTSSDRAEDPDGFEDMLRGDYDITCPRCSGTGKIDASPEAAREHQEHRRDLRTLALESGDWEAYYRLR